MMDDMISLLVQKELDYQVCLHTHKEFDLLTGAPAWKKVRT